MHNQSKIAECKTDLCGACRFSQERFGPTGENHFKSCAQPDSPHCNEGNGPAKPCPKISSCMFFEAGA